VVTSAAIFHLRMASPGHLVMPSNTHPFGDRRYAFAHNGHFIPPSALDGILDETLAEACGDTDSERYYLAIRRRIDAGTDPAAAIAAAAMDVRTFADQWESTNCLLLTSHSLYAQADHATSQEVIKDRGPDFFTLRYLTEARRIVVASTGWPQSPDRWSALPARQVLEVRSDLTLTVHPDTRPAVAPTDLRNSATKAV
jgi:predicted glutamine amidotransferase